MGSAGGGDVRFPTAREEKKKSSPLLSGKQGGGVLHLSPLKGERKMEASLCSSGQDRGEGGASRSGKKEKESPHLWCKEGGSAGRRKLY